MVLALLPQLHPEIGRHIPGHRNLVGRRRVRQQASGLRMPHQRLAGQPAHALHEAALDLPAIQRRIERATDVMQDVSAQQPRLAGERVDRHLGHRRTIGEIEKRPAAQGLGVIGNLRCAVVAGGRERDTMHPAQLGQGSERQLLCAGLYRIAGKAHVSKVNAEMTGSEVTHAVTNLKRCRLCRLAIEIRPGRRSGGRGIGHPGGIRSGAAHARQINGKNLGHDLRHLGEQTLTHFGAAMIEQHRAVGVDIHQRTGLIEHGGGKGNAELHRCDGKTAPDHRLAGIPGLDLLATGAIVRGLLQRIEQRRHDEVLELLAVVGDITHAGLIEITPPNIQRIHAQMAGNFIQHLLRGEHALRSAKAAKGCRRLHVGFAAMRNYFNVFKNIAIIRMGHGAIVHRP